MTSNATSAKATTSARRITGGNSVRLSGSGVPVASSGSARPLGRTRNWLFPLLAADMAGETRHRLMRRAQAGITRRLRKRFRRRIVSAGPLDITSVSSSRREPCGPRRVGWAEASRDALSALGQIMTQAFARTRRPSPRVTNALLLAGAMLMAPVIFASTASAQVLGYAPAPRSAFPSDNMVAPDEPAATGEASVLPERLRRTVVSLDTREAPGTV